MVLVVGALMLKNCRRRRRLRQNRRLVQRMRQTRSLREQTQTEQNDSVFTIYNSEPPPYDVAVQDKLPEYCPAESPPLYDDVIAGESSDVPECSNTPDESPNDRNIAQASYSQSVDCANRHKPLERSDIDDVVPHRDSRSSSSSSGGVVNPNTIHTIVWQNCNIVILPLI